MLVAHFSDIHLLTLQGVHPRAFLGKRATGGVNLLLNRAGAFPLAVAQALIADINEQRPGQVLISGDLTNLALPGEFELAKDLLRQLQLPARDIAVVPGNHDYYTRQSQRLDHFSRVLLPFLEAEVRPGPGFFPYLRLRGELALVALCSAHPSPPLMAYGTLGQRQREQAEQLLDSPEARGRFRLVLLHHSPAKPHTRWSNRLTDALPLQRVLQRVGANLVVHGHLHRFLHTYVAGPAGPIPVVGVGSGTWLSPRESLRRAQYNLYRFEQGRLSEVLIRKYDLARGRFVPVEH